MVLLVVVAMVMLLMIFFVQSFFWGRKGVYNSKFLTAWLWLNVREKPWSIILMVGSCINYES